MAEENLRKNEDGSMVLEANEEFYRSLPVGVRFHPSDKELVVDYLNKQVMNEPLPINKLIISLNVYSFHPSQLFETYALHGEEEMFFFTPRLRKYAKGNRPDRLTPNGYWKATGAEKCMKSNRETIGSKQVLVYYEGNTKQAVKTNWIMHEFKPFDYEKRSFPASTRAPNDMTLDNCVLCKIYNTAEKKKKNGGASWMKSFDKYVANAVSGDVSNEASTSQVNPHPMLQNHYFLTGFPAMSGNGGEPQLHGFGNNDCFATSSCSGSIGTSQANPYPMHQNLLLTGFPGNGGEPQLHGFGDNDCFATSCSGSIGVDPLYGDWGLPYIDLDSFPSNSDLRGMGLEPAANDNLEMLEEDVSSSRHGLI